MEQTEIVKSAVDSLLADGKITKEEIGKYFPETVDKIKLLADSLHTFLCFNLHTNDIEDIGKTERCDYYLEDQLAPEEITATRQKWRLRAIALADDLGLDTLDDIKEFHLRFANFCKEVYLFIEKFPNSSDLLTEFMKGYSNPR